MKIAANVVLDEMNIIVEASHCLPTRGHKTDAGLDLKAKKDITIPAHGYVAIDTGVHFEIPEGFYGKLESKSGLNIKHGIVCLGGVIDSGYTGPVIVNLYNMSNKDYSFSAGDKVVQIIFMKHESPTLNIVTKFDETERGNSGFGSTGR